MMSSLVRRFRASVTMVAALAAVLPSAAFTMAPSGRPQVGGAATSTTQVAPATVSQMASPMERDAVAVSQVASPIERDAAAVIADAGIRRSWTFGGASLGPVAPGASFGSPALFASGDRPSLSVVASSRGRVLDVRSWRGLRPGQPVQRGASMLSTDPDFWRTHPWGREGSGSTFDPRAGDFSVSVWLLPTDAASFPLGSAPVGSVSPNVVQKGRSTAAGGYWKLGLQLVRTSSGLAWAPECVLRGGDGHTVAVGRSRTPLVLATGAGTVVTCTRSGDRLGLTVAGDGRSASSVSVAGAARLHVDNTAAVSVANKPGATTAEDAYDGLLTDLAVTTG
ncbi:MAG: hypothetical protein ACRCY8_10025 [Dermatophilaceae bacterium]